jgi:hypothetical protein
MPSEADEDDVYNQQDEYEQNATRPAFVVTSLPPELPHDLTAAGAERY